VTVHEALPTWETKLLAIRDRLETRATEHRGMPQKATLENGWQLGILVDRDGRRTYQFRRFNDRAVEWLDFLVGARRLARVLGAGAWEISRSDRKGWFEVEFIAPAEPPASPSEAA